MARLTLSLAMDHYDRTLPFLEGKVSPEGIDLNVLVVPQQRHGSERHERMLNHLEFDICEMSLSSYLMAKARGIELTGIPVFPRRLFSQSAMYVNARAGIQSPKDLIGKKVGLNAYQTTLSVLAKGDLQHDYGVPTDQVTWITTLEEPIPFTTPKGIRIERLKGAESLGEKLVSGEIPGFISPRPPAPYLAGNPEIKRLFPDAKAEEQDYFRRHGYYPIMHLVAIRQSVVDRHPWVPVSVMQAFEASKKIFYSYIHEDPNWSSLAWSRLLLDEERRVMGPDPWVYGIAGNRKNLEWFIQREYEQGLIPKPVSVEELFYETVHAT